MRDSPVFSPIATIITVPISIATIMIVTVRVVVIFGGKVGVGAKLLFILVLAASITVLGEHKSPIKEFHKLGVSNARFTECSDGEVPGRIAQVDLERGERGDGTA